MQKYRNGNNYFAPKYEFDGFNKFSIILNEEKRWDSCDIPPISAHL